MITAYLRLYTEKYGRIRGAAFKPGQEGDIEVIAVDHGLFSPNDPYTGQVTGKRQYLPLTILKETDMATPILHQLLIEHVPVKQADIMFYGNSQTGRFGSGGLDSNIYTVTLYNAFVSRIDFQMQNNRENEGNLLPMKEQVSFVYESINWLWAEGNINIRDNLNASV
ncbi:MAG: type VI secretion system tube protein TssD [Niabella sp.]